MNFKMPRTFICSLLLIIFVAIFEPLDARVYKMTFGKETISYDDVKVCKCKYKKWDNMDFLFDIGVDVSESGSFQPCDIIYTTPWKLDMEACNEVAKRYRGLVYEGKLKRCCLEIDLRKGF